MGSSLPLHPTKGKLGCLYELEDGATISDVFGFPIPITIITRANLPGLTSQDHVLSLFHGTGS